MAILFNVWECFVTLYFLDLSSVLMQRGNTRIISLVLAAKRRAANGTPKTAMTTCQDSEAKWLMEKAGRNLAKEEKQM